MKATTEKQKKDKTNQIKIQNKSKTFPFHINKHTFNKMTVQTSQLSGPEKLLEYMKTYERCSEEICNIGKQYLPNKQGVFGDKGIYIYIIYIYICLCVYVYIYTCIYTGVCCAI